MYVDYDVIYSPIHLLFYFRHYYILLKIIVIHMFMFVLFGYVSVFSDLRV